MENKQTFNDFSEGSDARPGRDAKDFGKREMGENELRSTTVSVREVTGFRIPSGSLRKFATVAGRARNRIGN